MKKPTLDYAVVEEIGVEELAIVARGKVVDCGPQVDCHGVLLGLDLRSELRDALVLLIVRDDTVKALLEESVGDVSSSFVFSDGTESLVGGCRVLVLTICELYTFAMSRSVFVGDAELVFLHLDSNDVWARMDAEMMIGDVGAVGALDVRCTIVDVPILARGEPCLVDSTDRSGDTNDQRESDVPRGDVSVDVGDVGGRVTVEDFARGVGSDIGWLKRGEQSFGYCKHGDIVVVPAGAEAAGAYDFWRLCTDGRARDAGMCGLCTEPGRGARIWSERDVHDGVHLSPVEGALLWLSIVPLDLRLEVLHGVGYDVTVAQLRDVLDQCNAWKDVKEVMYTRCSHGVVLVSSDLSDCEDMRTLFSLTLDPDMHSAALCSACVVGSDTGRLPSVTVRASIDECVFPAAADVRHMREPGKCYTDAVPSAIQPSVASLGTAPEAGKVLAMLKNVGLYQRSERPVRVDVADGVAHVRCDWLRGTVDVGMLAFDIAGLPATMPVAGACGLVSIIPGYGAECGACRQRHVRQTKLVDDLSGCCHCGPVEPKVWSKSLDVGPGETSDHMLMSKTDYADIVVCFSREPMPDPGVCRAYNMQPDTQAQVRLHTLASGDKGFFVRGEFVQVWIPRGSAVTVSGVTVNLKESGMVVTARGAVSGVLHGCDRDYVVARARDGVGKIRWLHSVAGIDPAYSSFSRFWSRSKPDSVALFSFGKERRVPGSGAVASVYDEVRDDGVAIASMSGDCSLSAGFDGTAVEAVSADITLGPVRVLKGNSLVLGPRISTYFVAAVGQWKFYEGADAYALDDGGPSGSDGEFVREF